MNWTTPFFLLVIAPALAICLALLGLETLRYNLVGWILLFMGVTYLAGILIDYHAHRGKYRKLGAANRGAEERGNLSFWLILPGFLTAFFASPLEWMYLGPMLPRTPVPQAVGGMVCFAGVTLLVWTRLSLRSSYTAYPRVECGQPLVDRGPFRIVRHPGHLGQLLMGLGVAIGYSSGIGLGAVSLLLLPGLAYRIHVEERLLASWLGEVYAAYARRTRRLIPGLW